MTLNPANIIYLLQQRFDDVERDEIRADERKLADELTEIIIEHTRLYRGNKAYEDASESYSQIFGESCKLESAETTTTLSFADKKLKLDTTENGEIIAETIEKFEMLETLEFRGNTLGVDASIPIADALQSKPRLKRLLWSDLFTTRLKEEIPKTLKNLFDSIMISGARIVELDLSDNAIGPMAMPGIKEFLASEAASSLQILKLNNCGLGIAGKTVAECLMECHQQSAQEGHPLRLRVFVAGRNRLELISTKALSKAFIQIGTLEHIEMHQNGITAPGVIALAQAVEANPSLRLLNLGDNTFGQKGAVAMAKALSKLHNIESIDFSDCLCRNKGSLEIARQLPKEDTKLKRLDLSGNELSVEVSKEIVRQIQFIPGFEKLKIGPNCFGSQFDSFVNFANPFCFVDAGTESDDQGSLSEGEEEKDEDNVDDSWNDE